MLKWSEYDFVECLGVLPEVGEGGIYHSFHVEKDRLRLELTLFQYDDDVCIDIYQVGVDSPVFRTQIKGCTGTRYVKDANGKEFLEITAPRMFLRVYPHINVEMFQT